jgi:hypothetical protein
MLLPFALVSLVIAPVFALAWTARDRQLMATAIGAIDPPSRARGDAVLRGAGVRWRALWPLVRVESTRLARHPAPFIVALPFAALSLSMFLYGSIVSYDRNDQDIVIFLVPYAWGSLIASNLLTLRSRRWRSDELLSTTAAPPRARTLAHLLATVALLPGAMAMLALWFAVSAWSGRAIGTPRPAVVAVGLLLVIGGGCVGVAVARWLPRPAFGWVAVLATIILQTNFAPVDPRWRWLHFTLYGGESINYPALAAEHHVVHLVYLLGGILLVAAVALARDGFELPTLALGAVALVTIAGSAVLQVQPAAPDEASRLVQRLEDPAAGQVCSTSDAVTICADTNYTDLLPHWRRPIDGVLRRVPSGATPAHLVVRQRPLIDARVALPAEIATRVDPAVVWPDDEEVSVSNQWALAAPDSPDEGRAQLALGFRTASAIVGLPPDAWWSRPSRGSDAWTTVPLAAHGEDRNTPVLGPLVQCSAAGEARAVVAAWLAAQATPAARIALLWLAARVISEGMLDAPVSFDAAGTYALDLPQVLPEAGAVLAGADIVAVAALLSRPDDEVATIIAGHWEQLAPRGPSAPARTADLLAWFGLDPAQVRRSVVATGPTPDPEPHPEDQIAPPAITGPCPATR